jgi:hypothetical protein
VRERRVGVELDVLQARPIDEDEAMTSVPRFTSPTAMTEDTPPESVWSGWSHGGGQLAGVVMLYGIGCVA